MVRRPTAPAAQQRASPTSRIVRRPPEARTSRTKRSTRTPRCRPRPSRLRRSKVGWRSCVIETGDHHGNRRRLGRGDRQQRRGVGRTKTADRINPLNRAADPRGAATPGGASARRRSDGMQPPTAVSRRTTGVSSGSGVGGPSASAMSAQRLRARRCGPQAGPRSRGGRAGRVVVVVVVVVVASTPACRRATKRWASPSEPRAAPPATRSWSIGVRSAAAILVVSSTVGFHPSTPPGTPL